jgi:hypothetical protein
MKRTIGTTAGAVLLTTALLAGCSGGSSGSGGSAGSGATNAADGNDVKAEASAVAKAIGPGSSVSDITSKACGAIKPADAQALLKGPVTLKVEPFQCDGDGGGLTVSISPNDTTKKDYSDLGHGPALAGVGDEAMWFQPFAGATIPTVVSHQGSTTCTVQVGADVPTTTIDYTGKDPFFKITPTHAAAYAAKMGVLCAEVFSGLG